MTLKQTALDLPISLGWSDLERDLHAKGFRHIAGVDEAGRGPLAGPVVAAAVIFQPGVTIPGVTDSKLLSAAQRELLSVQIHQKALAVGVGEASVEEIDKNNILQATFLAMKRALSNISILYDYILVDGVMTIPDIKPPQRAVTHGDRICFSIAAASIIAKVHRDQLMREHHRQYPLYGFDRHKGYGTRAHLEAIKKHGICALHRRSFKIREMDESH